MNDLEDSVNNIYFVADQRKLFVLKHYLIVFPFKGFYDILSYLKIWVDPIIDIKMEWPVLLKSVNINKAAISDGIVIAILSAKYDSEINNSTCDNKWNI